MEPYVIKCQYCEKGIVQLDTEDIPTVFNGVCRCLHCGMLTDTGAREYLTLPVEKRICLQKEEKIDLLIRQSLNRTSNQEYLDLLKSRGCLVYPITEADRIAYPDMNFDKKFSEEESAEITKYLQNNLILLTEQTANEKGELKEEILQNFKTETFISKVFIIFFILLGIAAFVLLEIFTKLQTWLCVLIGLAVMFLLPYLIGKILQVATSEGDTKEDELKKNDPKE